MDGVQVACRGCDAFQGLGKCLDYQSLTAGSCLESYCESDREWFLAPLLCNRIPKVRGSELPSEMRCSLQPVRYGVTGLSLSSGELSELPRIKVFLPRPSKPSSLSELPRIKVFLPRPSEPRCFRIFGEMIRSNDRMKSDSTDHPPPFLEPRRCPVCASLHWRWPLSQSGGRRP